MNFTLTEQSATLAHMNVRSELHGDEPRTAVDLKITHEMPNTKLAMFDEGLLYVFYQAATDQAELIEGHLPELRFPCMAMPVKLVGEIVGGKVTVHNGIGHKSDIVLDLVRVDGFKIECKEGGTVECTFRVTAYPDEKQIGILAGKIGTSINVSVAAPSAPEQLI
jgi:hypothetical protein